MKCSNLENKLRSADRNSCKAQISRVTRDESNKVEDMARRIFKANRFNNGSGRCRKMIKIFLMNNFSFRLNKNYCILFDINNEDKAET